MALQSGSQIGPYQVLGPLGAGGMGEVYWARDTKLSRDVAMKVLPEVLARDHERMSRLTREAQVLASLNHPNIAAIYGLQEAESGVALILEYVDGETLDARINKGHIPTKEVVEIALQIAKALEAAHEKNVVHRDLKPANVKITTEGVVKVLDFGLAKALQDETSTPQDLSQSPTLGISATNAGVILGTPGYMAPEQARGLPIDRRADVWAFGVVLFEMISAKRVFDGATLVDTLAHVLEREPDWSKLPANTPIELQKLLRRCLAKNPKERLQAIGDARILLEEVIAEPSAMASVPRARDGKWKKLLPWVAAPVLFAAGFFLRPSSGTTDRAVSRVEQILPNNMLLVHNYRDGVDLSSDGRMIAFVARSADPAAGPRRLYVRNLDRWDAVPIEGTTGAQTPFFSPDGKWLGFQQGQQIKKVALSGGTPVVVVERLQSAGPDWGPPGIAWGKNGDIVFSQSLGVGLSIVRDSGGEPEEFTTIDASANEASHRLPHFLPDGNAVLFTVLRYTTITPDWKRAQVWVKPLKGERKLLLENALDARYLGNNVLVFARQAKLFAVRFDPSSLSVSGTSTQVLDGVTQALYGQAAVTWTGAAQYAVGQDGTLIYGPGSIEPPLLSSLVWFDRDGSKRTPVAGMRPMFHFAARILPDGKRLAFSELHLNKDIWVFDPARGTEDRSTFEGQNAFPIWSPDGSRVTFRSDRTGPLGIYIANVANMRDATPLTPGPLDVPSSWTADGKELAFTRGFSATGGNTDIYVVSVDNPQSARKVVATNATESFPEFSPDGKWLAYCSDENGLPALYVQPYPGPGPRVTITGDGNPSEPAWSKKGDELYYRSGQYLMSVRFKVSGSEFVPEKPVQLFQQFSLGAGTTVRATYDVAPDGRFLLNQPVAENTDERARRIFPATLRLVFHWADEVQRLLSTGP